MNVKTVARFLALATLMVSFYGQAESYRLAAGDVIQIDTYGEPDLTFKSLLVGGKGIISFPFVGDIEVSGQTVAAVERALVRGLKPDYLINPRVSVRVVTYRPFFINGEVRSPGSLAYSPGLTLRKAVSLAGGFTERASRSNIIVVGERDTGDKPKKIGLNYELRAGDVITVKQSFF